MMPDARTLIQTEDKSLVRDMNSKALLSTDRGALDRHRRDRARNDRSKHLEQHVDHLQTELSELRDQLQQVLSLLTPGPHGR